MHSLALSLYRTRTCHNHEIQVQHKIVKILSNLFHFKNVLCLEVTYKKKFMSNLKVLA